MNLSPLVSRELQLRGTLRFNDEIDRAVQLLDADPGGGEWSIRLTLGHIISSQRAYVWGTAWWQTHHHDANDPAKMMMPVSSTIRRLIPSTPSW